MLPWSFAAGGRPFHSAALWHRRGLARWGVYGGHFFMNMARLWFLSRCFLNSVFSFWNMILYSYIHNRIRIDMEYTYIMINTLLLSRRPSFFHGAAFSAVYFCLTQQRRSTVNVCKSSLIHHFMVPSDRHNAHALGGRLPHCKLQVHRYGKHHPMFDFGWRVSSPCCWWLKSGLTTCYLWNFPGKNGENKNPPNISGWPDF